MRILLVVLVLASAGLLAVDLEPSATPRAAVCGAYRVRAAEPAKSTPETVDVAFVKNGWVTRVKRVVPKGVAAAEVALRELTQGPTKAERRKGIRTAIPEAARLRSLRSDKRGWYASFSRSTFGSGSAETKRTRLWQIAATLAARQQGVRGARRRRALRRPPSSSAFGPAPGAPRSARATTHTSRAVFSFVSFRLATSTRRTSERRTTTSPSRRYSHFRDGKTSTARAP